MKWCRSLRFFRVHDDVIKWKHFPRDRAFVHRIHRLPVNSPHKGQWRVSLTFSLICAWTNHWVNSWVNNGDAGDLRRNRARYDVMLMVRQGSRLSRIFNAIAVDVLATLRRQGIISNGIHLVLPEYSVITTTRFQKFQSRIYITSIFEKWE